MCQITRLKHHGVSGKPLAYLVLLRGILLESMQTWRRSGRVLAWHSAMRPLRGHRQFDTSGAAIQAAAGMYIVRR